MWKSILSKLNFMGPGTGPLTLGMAALIFCSMFLSACQKARLEPKGPESPQVVVQQQTPLPPSTDTEVVPTRRPPSTPETPADDDDKDDKDRPTVVVVGGDDRDTKTPTVPTIDPNRNRPPQGENTVIYDDPEDTTGRDIRRCTTKCNEPVARPPISEKCPDPVPVQTIQETITYEKMTCVRDLFKHPERSTTRNLDLIFVVDTSSSLYKEMELIVNGFDAYLENIDEDMSVRIGVVLAHGKLDDQDLTKANGGNFHGKFYAPEGRPLIITYEGGDRGSLKTLLRERLIGIASVNNGHIPFDSITDGGEAGMASLNTLLDSSNYLENLDIFRRGAAVHFMFVADENDLCTPGEKPDVNAVNPRWKERYPEHFVNAPANITYEQWGYMVNCPEGFDFRTVAQKVEQMAHNNDNKIIATAFVYTSKESANTPVNGDEWQEENEIGYGYTGFVNYFNGIYHDLQEGFAGGFISELIAAGRFVEFSINRATQFYLSKKEDPENGKITGTPTKAYFWESLGEASSDGSIPAKCYRLTSADSSCPNVREVQHASERATAFNPMTQFQSEDRLVTLTPEQVSRGHGIIIQQCNVEIIYEEGQKYYKWPDGRTSTTLDGYMNTVPADGVTPVDRDDHRDGRLRPHDGDGLVVDVHVERPVIYTHPGMEPANGRFVIGGPSF